MPEDSDHIATMTRLIGECLNDLGIVASPDESGQVLNAHRRLLPARQRELFATSTVRTWSHSAAR